MASFCETVTASSARETWEDKLATMVMGFVSFEYVLYRSQVANLIDLFTDTAAILN